MPGFLRKLAHGMQPPCCEETKAATWWGYIKILQQRAFLGSWLIGSIDHQTWSEWAFGWLDPPLDIIPPWSWSLLRWSPNIMKQKQTIPTVPFLNSWTNRSHTKKKKKTVAVLCPKVWDGLSPSNSSWTHTPFTENVLSLLCPWAHLLFPQGIIEMLTFLWVSHPGTLYLHLYFGTYRVAVYLICLAYYTVSSSRTEIVLPCWFKVEAK